MCSDFVESKISDMKILLCPDKFKGSLSAAQACEAIAQGIRRHSANAEVVLHPLADGGDGLLDILTANLDLELHTIEVSNPLFRPIEASYGLSSCRSTAYIEMSRASGLVLLAEQERNCLNTTSYGTGELILHAIEQGVERVVLGIGGSATNDAGLGLAAALGYRFLDVDGKELVPVGKNLALVTAIDEAGVRPELASLRVDIASDVLNPFYGSQGAASVFAPQKGADEEAVKMLDTGLRNIAQIVEKKWGVDLQAIAGSGAAGGLGGGAVAFLGAEIHSGIDMIIEATHLREKLSGVDWMITGEGMLDEQSMGGKVVDGVLQLAEASGINTAVLCGACTLSVDQLDQAGIRYCKQIVDKSLSLQDAMANGYQYLEECAFDLMPLLTNHTDNK